MTTPASYSPGANDSFAQGQFHQTASGRNNSAGSITLGDPGLHADSDRWSSMSPRGVLQTALSSGSPAETDMTAEFGQQAVGNTGDQDMAEQSIQRSMMQRAGQIGSSDGVD